MKLGAILTVLLALVAFAIPCFVSAASAIAMPMDATTGCAQTFGFETCPQQALASDHGLAPLPADTQSGTLGEPIRLGLATDTRLTEPLAPLPDPLQVAAPTPLRL